MKDLLILRCILDNLSFVVVFECCNLLLLGALVLLIRICA